MSAPCKVDWPAIKQEFINGHDTLGDLGRKHGIKESTMYARGYRDGWTHERNTLQKHVQATATQLWMDERITELVTQSREDLKMANVLRRMVQNKFRRGIDKDGNCTLSDMSLRTLGLVAESAQRIARVALGGAVTPDPGLLLLPVPEVLPATQEDTIAIMKQLMDMTTLDVDE